MLKVFTSFTGIGSQEMALRNIGVDYKVVGTSEVDKWAIIAYDAIHNNNEKVVEISKEEMLREFKHRNIGYNFSTGKSEIPRNIKDIKKLYEAHIRNNNYGDIRKLKETELPDFDLFTYSFPCKDISIAGLHKGFSKDEENQSSLLWECEKIIEIKKPKYLLMENVKNLVGVHNIKNFKKWIRILMLMGYNSYWEVLNGKEFDVPQNRERVMMVSILKEHDHSYVMPQGRKLTRTLKDVLEDEETIPKRFHITRKVKEDLKEKLKNKTISKTIRCGGRGSYSYSHEWDLVACNNTPELQHIGNLEGKPHAIRRIYADTGLSPSLTSMNGGDRQPKISDGCKIRKLTPLECWRLMGYTDEDFYKVKKVGVSESKLYERAGRGIIVPMLEDIFTNLFNPNPKETCLFRKILVRNN